MDRQQFQVRDPIHGVITISSFERVVIDSRVFQRLRNIKQVGFADFAFPCATHTRYSHSLGALHVASKIFERVIPQGLIERADWERMQRTVRLAALLHDVGHPPLSHTTEMLMPDLSTLWPNAVARKATHEDFTRKLLLDSELTSVIEGQFSSLGVSPMMIASLLTSSDPHQFVYGGINYGPILRQIISSEIDADRMDYLLRDSFFCGVNYGKFDSEWLIDNLVAIEQVSSLYLGLKARAIFAFEDFLLSRYHMFASVYLHHTPVIMEKMLERFFEECPESFSLPFRIEDYVALDDGDLWQVLKLSQNRWAKRIVERKPFLMLSESYSGDHANTGVLTNFDDIVRALYEAKIEAIPCRSKTVLSTYAGKQAHPIFVESAHKPVLLEEFSPLFARYRTPAKLDRIFVDPNEIVHARRIMKSLVHEAE